MIACLQVIGKKQSWKYLYNYYDTHFSYRFETLSRILSQELDVIVYFVLTTKSNHFSNWKTFRINNFFKCSSRRVLYCNDPLDSIISILDKWRSKNWETFFRWDWTRLVISWSPLPHISTSAHSSFKTVASLFKTLYSLSRLSA